MGAQSAIFHFVGKSGMSYSVSGYLDDTANAPVRVSQAGAAGANSATDWTPPEPVALVDIIIAAATTKTQTQLLRNGQPTGDMILNAVYLASIATRPPLRVIYSPLARFGAIQIT
jgi:hypothetical protein